MRELQGKILPAGLGIILLLSAMAHLFYPALYAEMIPAFIPALPVNILAAISETIVGLALLSSKYRKWGGLAFMLLMIAFLPIHVWDVVRESPAVGSQPAAIARVIVQFLLIFAGWWIWKKN